MKTSVFATLLLFGLLCWAIFVALLLWLGLTPAQAIAVVVIAAGLCVLACFRMMDRAETEDGADGR